MPRNILFADDDLVVRKLYQPHLERAGFAVMAAGTGLEALRLAAEAQPEVAVLDINMPELDGFSVLLEMKRSAEGNGTPVILMSSDTGYYSQRKEILRAGAAEFLLKPFGPAQLLAAIKKVQDAPGCSRSNS